MKENYEANDNLHHMVEEETKRAKVLIEDGKIYDAISHIKTTKNGYASLKLRPSNEILNLENMVLKKLTEDIDSTEKLMHEKQYPDAGRNLKAIQSYYSELGMRAPDRILKLKEEILVSMKKSKKIAS